MDAAYTMSATHQKPKLRAQNVWKVFRTAGKDQLVVMQDLSLVVHQNEFVSLVGPSGCGKSTFLMMVAGLETVTQGLIEVDGQPVFEPGADRGMVFQSYTLFPWLTVFENVRFALRKSGLPRREQEQQVQHYLEKVGLQTFKDAYPNQLSGGMRQRVAIARALVYKPKMLLMDEPFGALDAQTRLLMQELLLQVWEAERTTVLFVTHDVEEAILLSDRVYVMTARPGRIKEQVVIDLPRPRSLLETEADVRFARLRKHILTLIREEARLTMEQETAMNTP